MWPRIIVLDLEGTLDDLNQNQHFEQYKLHTVYSEEETG